MPAGFKPGDPTVATDLPNAQVTLRRAGAEDLATLEPLYRALHEHQISLAPSLGGMPARCSADAWHLRLVEYRRWLEVAGAFVLLAERDHEVIGYAFVSIAGGFQGWESGEHVADIIDLSVAPSARGQGIGSALMEELALELIGQGIREIRLKVIAGNDRALSFYQRRGMSTVSCILLGRIGADSGL
jgi:ribosomal protein S18 acetylase RimI-like enzyme